MSVQAKATHSERISNPLLYEKRLDSICEKSSRRHKRVNKQVATQSGVANKAIVFMLLIAAVTVVTLMFRLSESLLVIAPVVAIATGVFIYSGPSSTTAVAPLFCVAEGTFLGVIARLCRQNGVFGGQVFPSALAVAFVVLICYSIGCSINSRNPVTIIASAIAGLFVFYSIETYVESYGLFIVLRQYNFVYVTLALLFCCLAALCFHRDFDNIKHGEEMGVPKNMEWYLAFSLCVTLAWMYVAPFHCLLPKQPELPKKSRADLKEDTDRYYQV